MISILKNKKIRLTFLLIILAALITVFVISKIKKEQEKCLYLKHLQEDGAHLLAAVCSYADIYEMLPPSQETLYELYESQYKNKEIGCWQYNWHYFQISAKDYKITCRNLDMFTKGTTLGYSSAIKSWYLSEGIHGKEVPIGGGPLPSVGVHPRLPTTDTKAAKDAATAQGKPEGGKND